MSNFQVNELVKIDNNPKILARGILSVGGLALKFALLPSSQGDPWVALPTREYTADGTRKFEKQVWPLDDDSAAELQATVLQAYNKSEATKSSSNSKKSSQIPF